MIIHTDSFRYLYEVLEGNEYAALFKGLRVLDLGCNVGAFTLWILPFSERVWSVDADQKHIDNLGKTLMDNDIKNVTLIKDKTVDLFDLMSGHAIPVVDVLKIDVEGDEYKIFGRDTFPHFRVRNIIGEYHADSPRELLTGFGYRYKELPDKHFIARL